MTDSDDNHSREGDAGRPHGEDPAALGAFLEERRAELLRMAQFRIDPRLKGRVDASDIVQNAALEAVRRFDEYDRAMPLSTWIRLITRQEIAHAHRVHLGTKARDVRMEAGLPSASGVSIGGVADFFAASDPGPHTAAAADEMKGRVETALAELGDIDREVLVLRHFEKLTNAEVAAELGMTEAAAGKRYLRALTKFTEKIGPSDETGEGRDR